MVITSLSYICPLRLQCYFPRGEGVVDGELFLILHQNKYVLIPNLRIYQCFLIFFYNFAVEKRLT